MPCKPSLGSGMENPGWSGLTQTDLAKELGGQPNVSKVLKGERELNLRQIRALAEKFKVEPNLFI